MYKGSYGSRLETEKRTQLGKGQSQEVGHPPIPQCGQSHRYEVELPRRTHLVQKPTRHNERHDAVKDIGLGFGSQRLLTQLSVKRGRSPH